MTGGLHVGFSCGSSKGSICRSRVIPPTLRFLLACWPDQFSLSESSTVSDDGACGNDFNRK